MAQHTFVLSRRVGRAPGLAERVLPNLTEVAYAGLTFVSQFERRTIVGPWGSGPAEREAQGHLETGRLAPEFVSVELGPWARDAVELRVRPVTRRPDRWTGRRQVRFFDHAHAAIDELARAIEVATPLVTGEQPLTRSA